LNKIIPHLKLALGIDITYNAIKYFRQKSGHKIGLFWGLTFLLTQGGCMQEPSDPNLLKISTGTLQGQVLADNNNVMSFKGIPFAQPPIGAARWKAPQPVKPWTEVHNATEPADIAALNRQGIVVVTPQYRLGIFSFFAHPELSSESPQGVSGNYGMQDLVQALKWVRSNIAHFGGDPATVTILGPSGGGTAVGVLLATPLSEGLFHRAAPLCSNAGISRMHFLKQEHLGQASAEELGLRFANGMNPKSLPELRNISAIEIQQHVLRSGINNYDPPSGAADVIDGWMFPQSILELHKAGQRHDVPVLLGVNEDEVSLFRTAGLIDDTPLTPTAYEESVKKQYGELSDSFLQHYSSEKPVDAIYDAARDRVVSYGTQTLARLSHNVSSPSYLYYMAHHPADSDQAVTGSNQNKGVSHCTDDKYFFDWYPQKDTDEIDQKLAKTMSDYMVNFIKTGNPNHTGLPTWVAYDRSSKNYMRFEDGKAQPSQDMLPGMWELYENIKERDEKLELSQHWFGGWASDDSLIKSRVKPD